MPKMTVVAVAGGTGDVGRTLVDELVASADFDVIVLARKVSWGEVGKRC